MILETIPATAAECEWYRAGYCRIGGMCTLDIGYRCKYKTEDDEDEVRNMRKAIQINRKSTEDMPGRKMSENDE